MLNKFGDTGAWDRRMSGMLPSVCLHGQSINLPKYSCRSTEEEVSFQSDSKSKMAALASD